MTKAQVTPIPDAWKLWWSTFQNGDEVIIITEDDKWFFGKIYATKNCLAVARLNGERTELDWDDVRFICQQGFPVKEIMGVDGHITIAKLDTEHPAAALREMFKYQICPCCGNPAHRGSVWLQKISGFSGKQPMCSNCPTPKKAKRVRFGDPHELVDISGIVLNPGNVYTPVNFLFEEVLVMESQDKARGLLWGLDTVIAFDNLEAT